LFRNPGFVFYFEVNNHLENIECISSPSIAIHPLTLYNPTDGYPKVQNEFESLVERVTGWGNFLADHNNREKIYVMANPDKSDNDDVSSFWNYVKADAFSFLKNANDQIMKISYYIRREILRCSNSDSPTTRGFRPLFNLASVKKYAVTLARCICFVSEKFLPVPLLAQYKNGINRDIHFIEILRCIFFVTENPFVKRTELGVVQFLIGSCLNQSGSLKPPGICTQTIAHLKFSLRSLVMITVQEDKNLDCMKFCRIDDNNLFWSLHSYMALLSSCAIEEHDKYGIQWSIVDGKADTQCLKMSNIYYSLKDFGLGYLRMNFSLKEKIQRIFGRFKACSFDNLCFYEGGATYRPGYSFLNDEKNIIFDTEQKKFIGFILEHNLISNKDNNAFGNKCLQILSEIDLVMQDLLILVFFGSGLPPRATELIQLTWCNDNLGNQRNLYWEYDTIAITQRIGKSTNIAGREKYIPRFIPKNLISNFLQYFVYLRPLQR
jgi:hypothetical protein